jgi:TonB family protein
MAHGLKQARSYGKQGAEKILRACVVQAGRVIDEQRLRPRQELTVGNGPKNTFVVPSTELPRSHQLFECKGGRYNLVFTESMRGKISTAEGARPMDFNTLKQQGLVQEKGGAYRLSLTDKHRGKLLLGDVTLIFQFVAPVPVPSKPKLPKAAKGSFLQSVDWPYAFALILAIAVEAPVVTWFHYVEHPEELSLDTMDSRWAELIVPDYKADKKKKKKPKPKGPKPKENKNQVKANKEANKEAKAERLANRSTKQRAAAKKAVQSRGILAILGTAGVGSAGGAVADVFGSGSLGGDLDSAFEGIGGVGMATSTSGRTKRGGGAGASKGIGGLGGGERGNVGVGKKAERRVGSVKTGGGVEVDGSLDQAAIAKVVRRRMRSVQDCYEKQLKRDPGLSGKIEVEFTIGESGSVEEATVVDNAMDSNAVGSCIVSRIRRWRFPKPDGGSVTVVYPFIFASSG